MSLGFILWGHQMSVQNPSIQKLLGYFRLEKSFGLTDLPSLERQVWLDVSGFIKCISGRGNFLHQPHNNITFSSCQYLVIIQGETDYPRIELPISPPTAFSIERSKTSWLQSCCFSLDTSNKEWVRPGTPGECSCLLENWNLETT